MDINLDEIYERSLHLMNQLSEEVQADIKESREFRREIKEELRKDREESRKDREESRKAREESRKAREESRKAREESRKAREESRGRMSQLQEVLQRSIEDGKRRSDELAADMRDLARSMKRTNERMERMGYVQGEIAEDLFYRNLPDLLKGYGIDEEDVHRNAYRRGVHQYDLVAANSSSVFVFEVKNKLRLDDINRFHDVQLPDFKKTFPEYENYKVYGGVGALVVRDDLQRRAEKLGLFVLTQAKNEGAHLYTPRNPWVL